MTGRSALRLISEIQSRLSRNETIPDAFAEALDAWTLSPLLLPIAELVARSWLETDPQNNAARDLLHTCLLASNRPREAQLIEGGAAPEELLNDSPEERAHIERLVEEAERRLRT